MGYSDVLGKYQFSIAKLGTFFQFLKTPKGYICCILIPFLLLIGIHIDYYIAMNVDAVEVMNDAVGGVTVNIVDDFSNIDPDLTMGEFTLKGKQARTFVQSRWNVSEHLNLNRIERQKEYMRGFVKSFRSRLDQSENFVLSTYEKVAPYIISDLPLSTLSGMVERYKDYEISQILSLEGDNVLGEEYYEFYVDEEKLEDLTLRLFYAEKE